MKKKLLAVFLIFGAKAVLGCDVCGCSLGGFSLGILPSQSAPFVGLRYTYASFGATVNHNLTNGAIESSADVYQRLDVMGRIKLSERINVMLAMPMLINSMKGTHQTMSSNGIGDPSILGTYQVFDREEMKNKSLYFGLGIKLPIGKFDLEQNGVLINRNFQMGTGSIDFISNLNYAFRRESVGFNVETSYKINTKNKYDYRFGNQFNSTINFLYFLEKKKLMTTFYTGGYFEKSGRHELHEQRVFNTGGLGLYLNGGVQIYVKRIRLGLLYQQPIVQRFYTDNLTTITAKTRFSFDFIYIFGK